MKIKLLYITLLFFALPIFAAHAATINLSAAASMTDAIKEIITLFSASHPNARIQPNFASSGSLAKQIEQGAPVDIYISANINWMKYLLNNHLIAPGTDRIFAYNALVFISTEIKKDLNMHSLLSLERIALGTPQNVPAGMYAKQAMEKSGIYAELEKSKRLVMAKDVRQALLYADRGEVDGAFVYKTDAQLTSNAHIVFTVPKELYDRVSYPIALTSDGHSKPLARLFYRFLSSPEVITVLEKYGFEPAP